MELRAAVCAALVLIAGPSPSAAPQPVTSTHGSPVRLSVEERRHILDGNYTFIAHVADLPASVKATFAGEHFVMADPGEEYQSTDALLPWKRLPSRRLVLAGCANARCFLHYEKGGMGHGYYVVVFDLEAGTASFRWGAAAFKPSLDLATLRSRIQSGEFDDAFAYFW